MSDWKKLDLVANCQRLLAEYQKAVIHIQTNTNVDQLRLNAPDDVWDDFWFAVNDLSDMHNGIIRSEPKTTNIVSASKNT